MCKLKKMGLLGLLTVTMTFSLSGWTGQVAAEEKYPNESIAIIVPYSAGGSTDLVSRIVAAYLEGKWGVPVNVVNKPVGNTVPATIEVYNATPDGYTLFSDSYPSTSALPLIAKDLPFRIMDRTFICMTAISPMVMVVPSSSPHKTLAEVVAEAQTDPGDFTWASLGGVSTIDVHYRQFFKAVGVDASSTKPIMAQGGSAAATLAAGGHVKICCGSTTGVLPGIKAGNLRAVGITGSHRHPDFPGVPTFEELGYPGVNVQNRLALTGPPRIPPSIVEIWDKAIQEMVRDGEVISKMKKIGLSPNYVSAHEMREHVEKEIGEIEKLFRLK